MNYGTAGAVMAIGGQLRGNGGILPEHALTYVILLLVGCVIISIVAAFLTRGK